VSAQASQRIIVLQMCVIVAAASNIQFQTSTGAVAISTLFPLAANGGFVLPYSRLGWMQTAVGDALTFTQSAATTLAIQLVWCPQ
jgi:hypothetical protein